MKEGIHPGYQVVTAVCACGNTWETRTTAKQIRLEMCSNCHPFYTGKQKLLDTAGRVERFEKRFAATGGKTVVRKTAVKKPVATKVVTKKAEKLLRSTPLPGLKEKSSKTPRVPKAPKAPAKA